MIVDMRKLLNHEQQRENDDSPLSLPMLIGDERRFKQVLINLVKNAIKFTTKGSIKIKATYELPSQTMIVHVEDTGVGIASEDLNKLFSKFGKLHRTAEINNEGVGLGLTIVKQIVEAADGLVVAESDGVGKGSCFIFSMRMPMIEREQLSANQVDVG